MYAKKRLLINWAYHAPVGHAIEAYRWALAFRNCNPDLHIAVVLNKRSSVELVDCVSAVDEVYEIDFEEFTYTGNSHDTLHRIPREWDYVFTDPRQYRRSSWEALNRYAEEFGRYIRAGVINRSSEMEGLPEHRLTPLALELPDGAKDFARGLISAEKSPRVSVLLGSATNHSRTPPMGFWYSLVEALVDVYPNIEIVLLGALDRERSYTKGVNERSIGAFADKFPQVLNAFDRGLINQLAIAEQCDLHISPHTGMSFAIQCVGVPWLALTSQMSRQYIVNGVPFINIFPDCPLYSCNRDDRPMLSECADNLKTDKPYLCMGEDALAKKMDEIIEGAVALIGRKIPYGECIRQYCKAMTTRFYNFGFDQHERVTARDFEFCR